jgi:hypothetical protein
MSKSVVRAGKVLMRAFVAQKHIATQCARRLDDVTKALK